MNRYQLAALQLSLLQSTGEPTKWLGSVSRPSKFSKPDIAFHKGGAAAPHFSGYATNASESTFVWNMGTIDENFCASPTQQA
jgi:hypothetical protein